MEKKNDLNILDFSQIFQALASGRKTGTLRVLSGGKEKYIYFRDGMVADLKSSTQKTLLGTALLKTGRINEDNLDRAIKTWEMAGLMLSEVLRVQNLVDSGGMKSALEFQIQEEICDLFTWKDISSEFTPGDPLPVICNHEHDLKVSVLPDSLVMEAARRIDEWELLRSSLPSLKDVYVLTVRSAHHFDNPEPTPEKTVLELIDELRDVEEITEKAPMSKFETLKILHQLASQGEIEAIGSEELFQKGMDCATWGDFKKCVRLYERAGEIGCDVYDLTNRLAMVHEALGQKDKAVENYLAFADIAKEHGELDVAVLAYQNALKIQPEKTSVRRSLVEVLIQQDRFEDVLRESGTLTAHLVKAHKNKEAVETWKYVIEAKPNFLESYHRLADLYQEMGETTQAIIELENLAQAYIEKKQRDKAIEIYKEMLTLDAECLEARMGLAQTLASMKKKDAAYAEYQTLAETLSSSGVITNIARSAFLINVYEKMGELRPEDIKARETLVNMYIENGQREKAVTHLKDLVGIRLSQEKPWEAVGYLRRIVGLEPDDVEIRNKLADALLDARDLKGSVDALGELVEYLKRKDRIGEVEATYERILEIDPFNVEMMLSFADFLIVLGDEQKAYGLLRRACLASRSAGLAEKGMDAAARACELLPDSPEDVENYVHFAEEAGEGDKALEYLQKLADLHLEDNNFGLASATVDRMFLLEGGHSAGREMLEKVVAKKLTIGESPGSTAKRRKFKQLRSERIETLPSGMKEDAPEPAGEQETPEKIVKPSKDAGRKSDVLKVVKTERVRATKKKKE